MRNDGKQSLPQPAQPRSPNAGTVLRHISALPLNGVPTEKDVVGIKLSSPSEEVKS